MEDLLSDGHKAGKEEHAMADEELTKALAEALGCVKERERFGMEQQPFCSEHEYPWLHDSDACPVPVRIAAALTQHVIPCGEDEEVHDCHPRCFCNPRKELIHESYRGEPTMNVVGVMLYHHEGCTPGLTSS